MNFDELVQAAVSRHASDVLVSPGSPPALRVNGALAFQEETAWPVDAGRRALDQLLTPPQLEQFTVRKTLDFAVTRHGRRFRCSAFHSKGHAGVAMRLLPEKIPTPEALGVPPLLTKLVHQPQGLIVFTGATGQGKSTTQASLIDVLNHEGPRYIVTLEDPIEYEHTSAKAVIDQRELGRDVPSISEALTHIVRQRPDVVMVGELRDEDSIRSTLTLAGTGHLVLTTLHTNDAVQAISRLVDGFTGSEQVMIRRQVASALLAVVNQRLVMGVRGSQVLAVEVLVNTPAVSKLIREGTLEQLYGVMEAESQSGSLTLNHSLEALVRAERIAPREAERYLSMRESRPALPKARAR